MNNLYDILKFSASEAGANTFLDIPKGEEERATLTYQQTLDKVNQQAQTLSLDFDIKAGDRIAIIAPKCYEQIVMYYAIWQLGAVIVPVSEGLGSDEITFILADAEAKVIFVHESFIEKVQSHSSRRFEYG